MNKPTPTPTPARLAFASAGAVRKDKLSNREYVARVLADWARADNERVETKEEKRERQLRIMRARMERARERSAG